ncbi:MAG TPA: family 1 glycosylhydrolase [Patescibacteria group bacterium]|nr:family 1 glycosylhydrolase [Patescibacteria group bacterium]
MYICIDIGGTTTRVALSDGKKLLDIAKAPTAKDFAEGIRVLKDLLAPNLSKPISAICIGMPGRTQPDGLIVTDGMLKGWRGHNLKAAVQEFFSGDILIENDASLATLGEANFGAGRGYTHVVYLTLSTGLGGDTAIGGKLLRGPHIEPKKVSSISGTVNFEAYLSGTGVESRTGKKPHEITDPDFWRDYHHILFEWLQKVTQLWKADILVLGGGMVNHDHIDFEKLNELGKGIDRFPEIKRTALGDEVGLYGAMAFLSSRYSLHDTRFFFGAATAAHQVEGNLHNNWTEWEQSTERLTQLKSQGKDPANFISGRGADHWRLYDQDFALAESLSHTAYRFSVEWSRLEPEEGKWDSEAFAHYHDMIVSMRNHGLEPFMTLWHWTLPLWVYNQGGVAWSGFPNAFARFAKKCAEEFDLHYILTLNEPEVHAAATYAHGVHPPAKKDYVGYLKAYRNLPKAHNLAHTAIKSVAPSVQVGMATHQILFQAYEGKLLNRILAWVGNYWWNNRMLGGMHKQLDFIGVNFYFRKELNFGSTLHQPHASCHLHEVDAREKDIRKKNPDIHTPYPNLHTVDFPCPYSDLGWELYPHGLGEVVSNVWKRYSLPVIVTENGLADQRDKYRAWYITEAVDSLMQAQKSGVNIFGYLHWSLLDNFEWQDGYAPRFGLIEVDYSTLERKVRPSAYKYKKIIDGFSKNL